MQAAEHPTDRPTASYSEPHAPGQPSRRHSMTPFITGVAAASQGDLAAAELTIREAFAAVCEQLAGRRPDQAQRVEGVAESLMVYEPLAPPGSDSLPPKPRAEWNADPSGARPDAPSPAPRASW